MSTTATADQRIDPALRKLIWILVLGALAPALDTTIVKVALATLGRALHTSIATSQWTITGYLLAMGMAMPVTGWVAERFGGKRMWLFSLTFFLVGSALSGAAWNAGSLIVFRVIQGIGAGLMMPIVTTLLVQAAGPKRLGGAPSDLCSATDKEGSDSTPSGTARRARSGRTRLPPSQRGPRDRRLAPPAPDADTPCRPTMPWVYIRSYPDCGLSPFE